MNNDTVIVLDAMRKQRNVADYSGDTIPESAVTECVAQAEKLLRDVTNWIQANKPELMET
ncbi:MAG: hypothetical protein A2V90_03315 [Gammaproteobacteria bacterium RBG_16_57_12]|nr:MAG: hypothetical protein A2V90_03315 [Gammaproteobacteria bacterium RBG_16_57_12]